MSKEKFGSIEVIEVWPRKTAMVGLLEKSVGSRAIGGNFNLIFSIFYFGGDPSAALRTGYDVLFGG